MMKICLGPDGSPTYPTRGAAEDDVAYGQTFAQWLAAAGRQDSTSEYDLRAAWRAGEDPAEYRV